VGIYVISYRNSVTHGAGLVKVLVASRDIPTGTEGSTIAGGGYLTTQTIPRRAVAPGSITSAAAVTSLITGDQIYKGQQVSLRQFVPITQGGIFAKFSGTQRIVVIPGDPNQLMAGTVSDGDRVDVVATTKYHAGNLARAATRIVLHNLLVLKAPEGSKSSAVGGTTTTTSTFGSSSIASHNRWTVFWSTVAATRPIFPELLRKMSANRGESTAAKP